MRLLALILLLVISAASTAHAERRVALVIGNAAYKNAATLQNPRNDAYDVSEALKRLGFETIVGFDLDKAAMEDATIKFARAAHDADVALVYYSGHAMQRRGINYLMPVDAELHDDADLRRLTRVDDIVDDLSQAKSLRILVLDACRVNPLADELSRSMELARSPPVDRGIARMIAPKGMILSFATQPNQTAADGQGRNSPYTMAFLKNIEAPEEIGTVFHHMTADVYNETQGKQLPELSLSVVGDFYLKGRPEAAASVPTSDAAQAWVAAQGTTSQTVLESFIRRYGDSFYGDLARARLEELKKNQVAVVAPPPSAPGGAVKTDEADSVHLYREKAAVGDARAMANLGWAYENGKGVAQDYAEAVGWYRKAADAGDALGMNNLGIMYEYGKGVAQDYAEALRWYRKAADAGYALGMNNLGTMDEHGKGVAQDYAEALRWYRKAADAGLPLGMNNLADLYRDGKGVAQDYAEALHWYRKAADAGYALSMANLGQSYQFGRGVTKDDVEAVRWYRKAADAGSPQGMNSLGVMYVFGAGVGMDEAEAVRWYRKAADAGLAVAMTNLGDMYRNAKGVVLDYPEAVRWYRKAADAGDPRGMTNLGGMYEAGEGVAEDYRQAREWYEKAVGAGYADAKSNLDRLSQLERQKGKK
jgi:uncharacterized protein